MKFCSVCGNQLNDDAKFCVICGTAFASNTVDAPATGTPVSSVQTQAPTTPTYAQTFSFSSEESNDAPVASNTANGKKDIPAIIGLILSVIGVIIILASTSTGVAGWGSVFDIGGLVCGIIGTKSEKYKGMAIPAIIIAGIAMVIIVPIKASMLTR